MPSGNETIQIIRRPKVDKLSPAPTGEAPEPFDVDNVQVLPRRSLEEGRGWVTVDGWDLWCFTEPEQEILFTDIVKVRGVEYAIEGKPARFDKRGTFKALNIVATRVGSA